MLRTSYGCLAIAAALRLAFDTATAQAPAPTLIPVKTINHVYALPHHLLLEWQEDGKWWSWLKIRSNNPEWMTSGYHPATTVVLSPYQPVIRQLPDGQWEITFAPDQP